jgi:hypothetical protein
VSEVKFFVDPYDVTGHADDKNEGTRERPFRTMARLNEALRGVVNPEPITILTGAHRGVKTSATALANAPFIEVCRQCSVGIDMSKVGSCRVLAHGDTFCSMACADAFGKTCDCGCGRVPMAGNIR